MLGFSTSAYYAWLKNKEERDKKQKDYEAAIAKICADSDNTYGPDRISGLLRR